MTPGHRTQQLLAITLFMTAMNGDRLTAESEQEPPTYQLADYIITGSHLPVYDTRPAAPLTVIDPETLALWGHATAVEALRTQAFSFGYSNNENESNSGTGSAGANLHGLGNLSTLTLINGRRAGGNSASGFQHGGFADLNLIPVPAIHEVQVVSDGSSVAYGSDAVAGTVNLLLHDRFSGQRIESGYRNTSDGDASETSLSFMNGQALSESTHLVLLGSWYQRKSIEARDRDISANTDRRSQGGQNQGSPTYPGRIRVADREYVLQDGISVPATLSDYRIWDAQNDRYNFSEEAVAIPETERHSLMAHLSHDIRPGLKVWGEFLYTASEFNNGLAPAPWFGGSFGFADSALEFPVHPAILEAARNSPHLPAEIDPADLQQVNYRSFEIGNLTIDQEKEALRSLIGLRGQFGAWHWESAALYVQTKLDAHYSGIADEATLVEHIHSGAFNPFATAYASGPEYDNAQALANAARTPINHYDETFWSYDIKTHAPIFELPTGDILFAAGFEFRREEIEVEIAPSSSPATISAASRKPPSTPNAKSAHSLPRPSSPCTLGVSASWT